ncbi:uncharacterized protein LOC133731496 [Rosa rugosa]|uniref:uncharacterized protein LOC133731496 n=1 Tax=Rosa rugosa TaxID=74645 RepID=UPI002B410BEA|nr:uncharacterized protein LOC133731496 [Rosa rugosa]
MDLDRQCTSDKSHSVSVGVEYDEEHRCQNASNYHEKHKTKKKELDEDGDKVICIMSSFSDSHEIEKDGDKESSTRNLRQEDSTYLDVRAGNSEICEEDIDRFLAKSCCGGSAQKTTQRQTTLRELLQLPADCGSPSGVMSQSKIFKHLEHQGSC